ncbi:hypothetical protein IV67_GL001318 [Weissella minor]|uniref:Uncharacterized protein n=2 Tax=Weissella minor TaxID=1620 RepID=A0A0R2JKQ6_9LACO|nr:hypothetical protein IV67_GL001318 [Weissella minor]
MMDIGILIILYVIALLCLMFGVQGKGSAKQKGILTLVGLVFLIGAIIYMAW